MSTDVASIELYRATLELGARNKGTSFTPEQSRELIAMLDALSPASSFSAAVAWMVRSGAGHSIGEPELVEALARGNAERYNRLAGWRDKPYTVVPLYDHPSALPATTPSDEAPRCTVCGKVAVRQDIEGAWWPPCEHAKANGLHTLQYPSEGSAPDTPTEHEAEFAATWARIQDTPPSAPADEVRESIRVVRDSLAGVPYDLDLLDPFVREEVEALQELLAMVPRVPPSAPDTKPDETDRNWLIDADLKIANAQLEIERMANGGRWRMSIPARPDYDSDLIIAAALGAAITMYRRLSSSPPEGEDTQRLDVFEERARWITKGRDWANVSSNGAEVWTIGVARNDGSERIDTVSGPTLRSAIDSARGAIPPQNTGHES